MDGFLIENPIKMDDLVGFPIIFGNIHITSTKSPLISTVFWGPNFAPKKVQGSPIFRQLSLQLTKVYQSDPCGVRAAKVGLDGQRSITIEWRDRPPEELWGPLISRVIIITPFTQL